MDNDDINFDYFFFDYFNFDDIIFDNIRFDEITIQNFHHISLGVIQSQNFT